MASLKKRKPKKPRSLVVLGMILTRKAGKIKDRRRDRGGSRNKQREMLADVSED